MAAATDVDMGEMEEVPLRPKVVDAKGILKQNREFLDFFWDIAKPEQEIRLNAVENLIQYLKKSGKPDELKYTLKRLVDGLSHTRETARPGFSLALAQILGVFEEISLETLLDQIKQKHDPQNIKKKLIRNAAFGKYFGILALSQSGRLLKEPQVVLECVQMLQSLAQYREHLKDLPRKTMVDILSETSEEVFDAVLLGALQSDLSSAFSTPEQLQLLLVAMQRFPDVLKPKKLKKLLGTSTVITMENVPKLIEVLKMAARSVKKDRLLPAVALDLLKVSLRENAFELFWREVVVNGMLTEQSGPSSYMCYRLLGSALPLLPLPQLQPLLSGEVMKHYGEHVVSAQLPDRFKFAPEMETYVGEFLKGCTDPKKQLTVMVGFSKLTNQGYPVVPSFWKVVQHLQPTTLKSYVDWLKDMFSHPKLESFLDFSTRRQQENQESGVQSQHCVFRLRKWIIPRLASIVENSLVKKEENMVMDIARFIFFHAFFDAKKSTPDIPETGSILSVPLDQNTRDILVNSFFGLLQSLNHMPVLGDTSEGAHPNERRGLGITTDGTMWIYRLVTYAEVLLTQTKYTCCAKPLTHQQKEAWDRMLASVEKLHKKAKKSPTGETAAFQQLFLLIGMYLFKAPEESVDLLQDLHDCVEKAQEKKAESKRAEGSSPESEPQWVEVVVEILLSLLSQPSRLIRQVCKTVFARICPHVTREALEAILDVLDPEKDEEESAVVVTDEHSIDKNRKGGHQQGEDECDSSEDDSDDEAMEEGEDEEEEEPEVDQNFRLELMKVLQGQQALAIEGDDSEDEDLDDEAMMKLDDSIAALFSEQKKRIQAKKDQKERMHKEKALVRDFKIKVLDLVEVFLAKQPESPLVLGIIEPLLNVIESCMSSETNQQEQDFLRKTADIFRNQLCKIKRYCKDVSDMKEELHDMTERVLARAQKLTDSSVSLYYFSASLFLVKLLRGSVTPTSTSASTDETGTIGHLDVERVTSLYKGALRSFMTRRKSALSGALFVDLFTRFPVLCVRLLDTAVEYITEGVRAHQQGQACFMVLRGMQTSEVRQLMTATQWVELCKRILGQVAQSFSDVTGYRVKVVQEKVVKALELSQFLVRNIQQQKLEVDLQPLQDVLQPMNQLEGFRRTGQLEDTYWGVMKHFGVLKPKVEKVKKEKAPGNKLAPKKKGFLPETKKRKNRKKAVVLEGKDQMEPQDGTVKGVAGGEGNKRPQNKKNKRKPQGAVEGGPALAKKAKPQASEKQKKKKNKKVKG